MKYILGVDVGGSTTKIVAFDENRNFISTLQVKAADQVTSLYGAIGNLLFKCGISLTDVLCFVLTGVGSTQVDGDIYGIQTHRVKEIEAIGHGGVMLAGIDKALVVSMGTGTAFVEAKNGINTHIGGSGVGGGTLLGLASKICGEHNIDAIVEMALDGDLNKVDLTIADISKDKIPLLPDHATASNFGKISSTVKSNDMAIGLMNMMYQTIGMMAVFACRNTDLKKVIVTGSVATLPLAKVLLSEVGLMYDLEFIIPENAMFATAIGAAIIWFDELK